MEPGVAYCGSPAPTWISSGDWLAHQACYAHQVVGGRHEVARQLSARQAAVARSAEAAHFLQPAEDLLNGLFTNDKFCWSRPASLRLNWWRRAYRDR
jgi:hypothetical protein